MKVAVSYITSINDRYTTIKLIDKSNADFIHVDLMDGLYVEKKNFEIDEIVGELKHATKPLDIHLMVEEPSQYIDALSSLIPHCINIHPKTTKDFKSLVNSIKQKNIKVGLVINPDDEIKEFIEYFSLVDQILVMSVVPGRGGQSFMLEVLPKLKELKILKHKFNYKIAVDGGITDETIKYVNFVDMVVSGSFICLHKDYNKQIDKLKNI